MKRSALVLVAGIAVGAATYALLMRLQPQYDPGSLDGQLAWMKSELHLSDGQFARIRELHEASGPRLRALASQVAVMQQELIAFERTRRASDKVDFVEFARFVEARRDINRECLESTRELVRAAASAMTPGQRAHYFGIVAQVEPLAATHSTN
jgi:hypothetical protein